MVKNYKKSSGQRCPCGSGHHYEQCCAIYHAGSDAPSAELLMRSRYSAYVLRLEDYLLRTWARDHVPQGALCDPAIKWVGLTIVSAEQGEVGDENGTVTFVARYKLNGRACHLSECSRFVREDGKWRYSDGDVDWSI